MALWQSLFGMNGRIGRSTFWLLVIAVLLLDLAFGTLVSDWIHDAYQDGGVLRRPDGHIVGPGFGLLVVVVLSAWILLALQVKRAHDRARSGWWLLIGLVPVYGQVRLIVELGFLPGTPRRNRYGEAPGFVGEEPPHYSEPSPALASSEPELDSESTVGMETAVEHGHAAHPVSEAATESLAVGATVIAVETAVSEETHPSPEQEIEPVSAEPHAELDQPERSVDHLIESEVHEYETPVGMYEEPVAPGASEHVPELAFEASWVLAEQSGAADEAEAEDHQAPAVAELGAHAEEAPEPVAVESHTEAAGVEELQTLQAEEPLAEIHEAAEAPEEPLVKAHDAPAAPEEAPEALGAPEESHAIAGSEAQTADPPKPPPAFSHDLTWTPAPSHEAYAELGVQGPYPANDPHNP